MDELLSDKKENDTVPWRDEIAKAQLRASKGAKRGSKTREEGSTGNSQVTGGEGIPPSVQIMAEKLFQPKQWELLASVPFIMAETVTGSNQWELDKEEKEILSVSAAACAQYWMPVDPKYLCLALFLSNMGGLISIKFAKFKMEVVAQRAKEVIGLGKNG